MKILAVAGATSEQLARHGLVADLVGDGGGAALAQAALDAGVAGPILVLGARDGRTELADRLTAAGVIVRPVAAYDTLIDEAALAELAAEQARAPFAALGVGSPKIAAAWHRAVGAWPAVVGALGETTAEALRALGCPHVVVAPHPSLTQLVTALGHVLDPGASPLAVSDEIE